METIELKGGVYGIRCVLKHDRSPKEVLYSWLSWVALGTGTLNLKFLITLHRFEVALLCVTLVLCGVG